MPNNNRTFDLTEGELIVLNSFFLSLPLPPVLMFKNNLAPENVEFILIQATSSLTERGLIKPGSSDTGGMVDPDLTRVLNTMAYANQMLQISIFSKDAILQQQAFYLLDDQVIHQQVSNIGVHHLSISESKPGEIIAGYLKNATEGHTGKMVILPMESWHYLLSLRVEGEEQTGLQAFSIPSTEELSDDQQNRIEWSKETLIAPLVIEVISMQNRITSTYEKAAFVIGKTNNWLVTEGITSSGQKIIRANSMNRIDLNKSAQVLLVLISQHLAEKEQI